MSLKRLFHEVEQCTNRGIRFSAATESKIFSAFSPDGARIATASEDRTARVWDAASGKEIAVLRGHEDEVQSAAFSPNGTRIVTASLDGTARVWDVSFATMPTQDLIAEVCQRRLRGLSTLTRDEMRLAGYPDDLAPIDVCAGMD